MYNCILINSNIPSVGPTSVQSEKNFKTWINNKATRAVGVIVQGLNGPIDGCYHHLAQSQADMSESNISALSIWNVQCLTAQVTTGKFLRIVPSGVGNLKPWAVCCMSGCEWA